MRMAHRLLLILSPATPEDGPGLRDALEAEDWVVALRSDGEEPDPEIQIFVADAPGEAGLWYRLAPITFLGGSLVRGGQGRDPCEPAALGSAILTGPDTGPYRRRVPAFSGRRRRPHRRIRGGAGRGGGRPPRAGPGG